MKNVQYLLHHQIDKNKWDYCINKSPNGLLYSCSKYLDCMANHWDALMLNDYEYVMPLPQRKKAGIHYLFQPSITPILGVFGENITTETVTLFLAAIPNKFKVWDLSFNTSNKINYKEGNIINRNNYILNLNENYQTIYSNYSENIKRNIIKAIKSGCVVKNNISFEAVATICKAEFPKFTKVEEGLFEKLENVFKQFNLNAVSYGVFSAENKLVASAIFIRFNNRIYYWLVGNTPESKKLGAASFLLNAFIEQNAGQNLILDFEGSDSPTVAGFYKKFGSKQEIYSTLYVNKLMFPFSLLKRLPSHYKTLISQFQ